MTIQTLALTLPSFDAHPSRLRTWGRRWQAEVERRRVQRVAERGRPVILGSLARPFEMTTGREILDELRGHAGLSVHCVVETLDAEAVARLTQLDHDHAVVVEVVGRGLGASAAAIRSVRRLAEQGLEARLLLVLDIRQVAGAPSVREHTALAELAAQVRDAGGTDLGLAEPASEAWNGAVALQRFRYALPQARAGRG